MTLIHTIKHAFTSLKPNGADATVVRPSDWNANHGITFETGGSTILGRGGTSQGPVQELVLDGVFDVSGGVISITSLVPVGIIMDYGGGGAPNGWHLCDGALLLRDDYVDLFAVIGESFGVGDGFSTFAVPDLRGRSTFGRDGMGGTAANRISSGNLAGSSDGGSVDHNHIGSYGGEETHVLILDELPTLPGETNAGGAHSHRIANTATAGGSAVATPDGHLAYKNTGGSTPYELAENTTTPTLLRTSDESTHTHTIDLGGLDEPHQNLPPMMLVTKIIFTGVFT